MGSLVTTEGYYQGAALDDSGHYDLSVGSGFSLNVLPVSDIPGPCAFERPPSLGLEQLSRGSVPLPLLFHLRNGTVLWF